MNKIEFLEVAPNYYALGVLVALGQIDKGTYRDISRRLETEVVLPEGHLTTLEHLRHAPLFDSAMKWLISLDFVRARTDIFAPTIYFAVVNADKAIELLAEQSIAPFEGWLEVGQERHWLTDALENVSIAYEELGITDYDFTVEVDEWSPLPIERTDQELVRVNETLSDAIQAIEEDNGYGIHHPEERDYVVESLKRFQHTIQTAASTSFAYVRKNALEPLNLVIKRFGPAALGIVGAAAKAALIEWLKKKGLHALVMLLGE